MLDRINPASAEIDEAWATEAERRIDAFEQLASANAGKNPTLFLDDSCELLADDLFEIASSTISSPSICVFSGSPASSQSLTASSRLERSSSIVSP